MQSNIVISGIGIISGMGNDMDEIWESVSHDNDTSIRVRIPDLYKSNVKRRMNRFSYMSLVTAAKALKNSHIDIEKKDYDFEKIGTIFNSGYGPIESNFNFARKLINSGPEFVSPIVFAGTVSNSNVGHVCMNLGLKGPSTSFMGSNAIGYAYDLLRNGVADAIIAGGMEQYDETIIKVYSKMDYVSKISDSKYLAKPYDVDSDGITLAEGATLLFLENEQRALERGNHVSIEIVGYAGAFSAELPERSLLKVDENPYFMSMKEALRITGVEADEIDFIYSAATGAKGGDLAELRAINQLFDGAIPITTQIGKFGYVYGANSTTAVALAAMMLQKNEILPIYGLINVDLEAKGNLVRKSVKSNLTYALINSIEMGGNISSVIIRKY